jgi:protein TonB
MGAQLSTTQLDTDDLALEPASKRKALVWGALGLLALALIVWGVSHVKLSSGSGKKLKSQTTKITLPDAPPPPPPKVEEKRPEPKQDNKPQVQQQKVEQAPVAPAPLKMEGAAGNSPSSFQSGGVTSDYKSGSPNTNGPGGGSPSAEDRRRSQFYVNNMRRALKEELERHLDTDERQMEVNFSIWIGADGRLSRYELVPTGNARIDADANKAFEATVKTLQLEKPGGTLVQPLRLKLLLQAQGA